MPPILPFRVTFELWQVPPTDVWLHGSPYWFSDVQAATPKCSSKQYCRGILSDDRSLYARDCFYFSSSQFLFIFYYLDRTESIISNQSVSQYPICPTSRNFRDRIIPLISIFINIRNIYKLVINLFTFSRKLKLVFDLAFISRRTTALRKKEGAKNQTP